MLFKFVRVQCAVGEFLNNPGVGELFGNLADSRTGYFERWVAPLVGCIKVNVDGAFKIGELKAGIGVVFGDSNGAFSGDCVFASSSFMAELLAVNKAIEMLIGIGIGSAIVE